VSSKACRWFTLTIYGFTVRQWEVTGVVIVAAGPRSSTIKHVDTNSWASTAAGVDMRTSVEENVHELALDASRVDERGAITALLGTGWDFARAERHLAGPGVGAAAPFKRHRAPDPAEPRPKRRPSSSSGGARTPASSRSPSSGQWSDGAREFAPRRYGIL